MFKIQHGSILLLSSSNPRSRLSDKCSSSSEPTTTDDDDYDSGEVLITVNQTGMIRIDDPGANYTRYRYLLQANDSSCHIKLTFVNASFDRGLHYDAFLIAIWDDTPIPNKLVYWRESFVDPPRCNEFGCGVIHAAYCRVSDCRLVGDHVFSKLDRIELAYRSEYGDYPTFYDFQYELYCDEPPVRPPTTRTPTTARPTPAPTLFKCGSIKRAQACLKKKNQGCKWKKKKKVCRRWWNLDKAILNQSQFKTPSSRPSKSDPAYVMWKVEFYNVQWV